MKRKTSQRINMVHLLKIHYQIQYEEKGLQRG